jgi:hypothetical protein
MSSAGVGRSGVAMVFRCLEARQARLSAAALERSSGTAAALQAIGVLQPSGHEPVTLDDAGLRQLTWSPEKAGFGYFSEARGWVSVPNEVIQSFSIDMAVLIALLTAKLDLGKRGAVKILVANYLWEVAEARLGNRPKPLRLLFGRRLHDTRVWSSVEKALSARPSGGRTVLLTSTPPQRWPSAPAMCQLLWAEGLLDGEGSLSISPERMIAGMQSNARTREERDLVVIGDGKEVRFKGETFLLKKGAEQRRVVCFLHDRYIRGDRWTSSEEIIEELGLGVRRIRDLFKRSPAWNHLLTEKSGMCGFCFEEDPGLGR